MESGRGVEVWGTMSTTAYGGSTKPAQTPMPYPRMVRPRTGRVVAGVAAGLSAHLRVDVFYVRLILMVLSVFSGFGVLFYAGLWMFTSVAEKADATDATDATDTPEAPAHGRARGIGKPKSKISVPHPVNLLFVALALLGAFGGVNTISGVSMGMLIPLAVAATGALIAWQAYDRGLGTTAGQASVVSGAALVIAGVVVAAMSWEDGEGFGAALSAVVLTLLGIGALVVPLGLKLWRKLAEEQAAKAASDERAEIASRLHDSVLQTLALIQKRAGDSAEVVRLARGQERELRAWLFDADEKTTQTIFGAVGTAAGEVEDLFGVRVRLVTVGEDAALTEATRMAVMAAREAMVNAAKHAGVDAMDIYAELLGGELSIFIRDRGVGFDVDAVAPDRHGICDSIVSRMERVGGSAKISSTPGQGTEVELTVAS